MLELRNDDVLQIGAGSAHHGYSLREKTPFEWFLWADSVFGEYNFPCTLSVLSEGIDHYPEWVEHIKKNKHRYKIELHGSSHHRYNSMTAKEGFNDLKKAKEKIENTFGVKIENWVVPYGKRNLPDWAEDICKKLGIGLMITRGNRDWLVFHYWHKGQVEKAHKFIKWQATQDANLKNG